MLFSRCGEWGYSLVAALASFAGASLVAEHGLQGTQASVVAAHRLKCWGSRILERRLSTCGAQA